MNIELTKAEAIIYYIVDFVFILILSILSYNVVYKENLPTNDDEDDYSFLAGFFYILLIVIPYAMPISILSLVGLITSISYKEALNRRKNIITSVLLLIAPIVAELLIVAVFLVLPVILG